MRSPFVQPLVCALAACIASAPARGNAQTPQQQPLVTSADVTYVGSFKLPRGTYNDPASDLTFGGAAMSVLPNGDLLLGGHNPRGLCRVTVPEIGGTASLVANCQEVPGTLGTSDAPILGGSLWWNNRLLVSKYIYYDGNGAAWTSHQASSDNGASWIAPVKVGSLNAGFYGGYMAVIPSEWRSLLGGPAITGQGVLSIISRTSFGPAAFVFDPDTVGTVNPVPVTPLVYYTMDAPLADPQVANELFNRNDKLGGIAFVPGTRSMLVIGSHGMGTPCYGGGSEQNPPPPGACYDPTTGAQGEHAYPYRGQVWAYDANDLLEVKNGRRAPWSVRPYAVFTLPGIAQDTTRVVRGGVAFDPRTRRVYVADDYGEYPRLHVFQIGAGTAAPPTTTTAAAVAAEVCADGVDNDGDGQVDEGCAPPAIPRVPGAPVQLSARTNVNSVTLTWSAPLDGDSPTGYLLEAGLAPGETIVTAPTGLGTSVRVDRVGVGRYYVRLRALNAQGPGPASNEVVASVGCSAGPGKMKDLEPRVRGNNVTMTWTDPDGCSGTAYNVAVGMAPGATDVQVTSEDTRVTALAQPGTYFARVMAASDLGAGQPSDEVKFVVSQAGCQVPDLEVRLGVRKQGSQLSLWWAPANPALAQEADLATPLQYMLEAGSAPGRADIARVPMGRATSFTALVPSGVYYLRVRAQNACGGGPASSEQLVRVP